MTDIRACRDQQRPPLVLLRACALPARDPEPLRVLGEVVAPIMFEARDALVRRRCCRADSPVISQPTSESQPMKALATLLQIPLLAVAQPVRSPVQSPRPALVDSPALLIIHPRSVPADAPSQRVPRGRTRVAAVWSLAPVVRSASVPRM
jgi:hypothetical protein